MAPELVGLRVADDGAGWTAAGFTVDDGLLVLGGVEVTCAPSDGGRGISSWSLSEVDVDSIDGLATLPSVDLTDDPGVPHPNGATTIDHVVVASPDLPRTIAALDGVGIEARRTRDTDQYGAPMRQVFFRLGRPILELIGPPEPMDDRPASFFGLAINVADLDATKDLLGDDLSDPKDAVQPGRRIATLRHEALDMTVPIAFMSE